MAVCRIDKKKAAAVRTIRPRAVAIAARQAFLARTQRNVPDDSIADPPESPAIQAAPLWSEGPLDLDWDWDGKGKEDV
jgi:hypothetical protein